MNNSSQNRLFYAVLIWVVVLSDAAWASASGPVATLTLQYQQSERKWVTDGQALFGKYLGTGNGSSIGQLQGSIGWDLYEDQSRADFHPAHLRCFLEQDGKRYQFQIIGVFTPASRDTAVAPDGNSHPRRWTLSGAIVFEDESLLNARHLPVTGSVDLRTWTATYFVWSK